MNAAFGREALLDAFDCIGRYFPVNAASPEKLLFLLKNMNRDGGTDAPEYPR